MTPGNPARHDYEYERNGVANLFMMLAPWKDGATSRSPTATDYAQVLKDLSDAHFPDAKSIVLVQDNLNCSRRFESALFWRHGQC